MMEGGSSQIGDAMGIAAVAVRTRCGKLEEHDEEEDVEDVEVAMLEGGKVKT